MSDVIFNIQPVDEKPKKETKAPRGSKYETIINAFMDSNHKLVRVDGTSLDANYLAGQLKKIIDRKALDMVTVSMRNKEVYLEKS